MRFINMNTWNQVTKVIGTKEKLHSSSLPILIMKFDFTTSTILVIALQTQGAPGIMVASKIRSPFKYLQDKRFVHNESYL